MITQVGIMVNYKLFINARFLTQSITGVQRYALELVKSLDSMIDADELDGTKYSITLLAPRNIKYIPEFKHIKLRIVGRLKGHFWEQIELPYFSSKGLLINFCNAGPLLKRNQIVTIHDAAVFATPSNFSFIFRSWYKVLLYGLCKNSLRVITVSNFSMKELIRYCQIDPGKLRVIYEGKEHAITIKADNNIIQKLNLTKKKYILAVSSLNPNKNFRAIIDALEEIKNDDFEIIVAGGTNPKIFEMQEKFPDKVKYVGYVSDNELRTLYEHAYCFIFPSFYEGFGLPPLEAMALGCPVIVSHSSSMPEVCADAALYCDPYNPSDLANQINRLLEEPELRDELIIRGIQRGELFTWKNCGHETMKVIKEALNK
jgi:glycosyltransferase involved in cell wall biosynthesis